MVCCSSQEYNPNNFDWGMNFGGGFKGFWHNLVYIGLGV
jgi:hypothetical protein